MAGAMGACTFEDTAGNLTVRSGQEWRNYKACQLIAGGIYSSNTVTDNFGNVQPFTLTSGDADFSTYPIIHQLEAGAWQFDNYLNTGSTPEQAFNNVEKWFSTALVGQALPVSYDIFTRNVQMAQVAEKQLAQAPLVPVIAANPVVPLITTAEQLAVSSTTQPAPLPALPTAAMVRSVFRPALPGPVLPVLPAAAPRLPALFGVTGGANLLILYAALGYGAWYMMRRAS